MPDNGYHWPADPSRARVAIADILRSTHGIHPKPLLPRSGDMQRLAEALRHTCGMNMVCSSACLRTHPSPAVHSPEIALQSRRTNMKHKHTKYTQTNAT